MRVIVSTIGTPPYGISKYLVDISQPTFNKNQDKAKHSKSFVSQAQTWKIEPDEIQVHMMSQTFIHQCLLIMQLM